MYDILKKKLNLKIFVAIFFVGASTFHISTLTSQAQQSSESDLVTNFIAEPLLTSLQPTKATISIKNNGNNQVLDITTKANIGSDVTISNYPNSCNKIKQTLSCQTKSLDPGKSLAINLELKLVSPDRTSKAYIEVLPTTTSSIDYSAGEILVNEFNLEADADNDTLKTCWPIDNSSPNMDINGGGSGNSLSCDGVNDHDPIAPSNTSTQQSLPSQQRSYATKSWEIKTKISITKSGSFRSCAINVDDGAYVALSKDKIFSANEIVHEINSQSSQSISNSFYLSEGDYYVLIRVSNRGHSGINNGGATLGGFDSFGLVQENSLCDTAAKDIFGTSELAWVKRVKFPLSISNQYASDFAISSTLLTKKEDGNGIEISTKVKNLGTQKDDAKVTISIPKSLNPTIPQNCTYDNDELSCTMSLKPDETTIISTSVSRTEPNLVYQWKVDSINGSDINTSNNQDPGLTI